MVSRAVIAVPIPRNVFVLVDKTDKPLFNPESDTISKKAFKFNSNFVQ